MNSWGWLRSKALAKCTCKSTQVFDLGPTCVSFGHPLAMTCLDFGRAQIRTHVDAIFTVWPPIATSYTSSFFENLHWLASPFSQSLILYLVSTNPLPPLTRTVPYPWIRSASIQMLPPLPPPDWRDVPASPSQWTVPSILRVPLIFILITPPPSPPLPPPWQPKCSGSYTWP